MKRNRILMFLSALGVLVGLGVVVVLMFQDSSTPKGPAIGGPARTDATAPAKPASRRRRLRSRASPPKRRRSSRSR